MNACVDVDRQRRRFFLNRRFSIIIEKNASKETSMNPLTNPKNGSILEENNTNPPKSDLFRILAIQK